MVDSGDDECWSAFWPDRRLIDVWNQSELDRLAVDSGGGCDCARVFNATANVHCMPFPLQHNWWTQAVYISAFTMLIAVALCGNGSVMWIVLYHRRMRTVTNYFLLNLALADTSIAVFNVCFSFIFNLYYHWYFGETYCHFNNFMGVTPTCASVFTMMAMSWDRYMALVHPLSHHLSKKSALTVIVAIWVLAALAGVPPLVYSKVYIVFFYDAERRAVVRDEICLADDYPDGGPARSTLFKIYQMFNLIVAYLLPLVVLSVTYSLVARALWRSRDISQSTHGGSNLACKEKVVKMLGVVVALFMVCWLPYQLYFCLFVHLTGDMEPKTVLYGFLGIYWLAMASTTVNPIIYCWMNERFRIGFRYIFRWLPCVHISRQQYLQSGLFTAGVVSANGGGGTGAASECPTRHPSTAVHLTQRLPTRHRQRQQQFVSLPTSVRNSSDGGGEIPRRVTICDGGRRYGTIYEGEVALNHGGHRDRCTSEGERDSVERRCQSAVNRPLLSVVEDDAPEPRQ